MFMHIEIQTLETPVRMRIYCKILPVDNGHEKLSTCACSMGQLQWKTTEREIEHSVFLLGAIDRQAV